MSELGEVKWPDPLSALKEVGLVIFLVALTGGIIVGWDNVVRYLYTEVLHFIPNKEDLADYANRFSGIDLPSGWTDNMNEDDIASFIDKVGSIPSGGSGMPEL